MLNIIKSTYFIDIIFSYLEEKQKLKLVKINKGLQNFLNINIINYKLYKGKYFIFETNKTLKEYEGSNDALIFEGEYLNREKNGKGKEYNWNGDLLFEGEYLNGKRNGKGKEYYCDGNLCFEGEYLDGKRLKGDKYDINWQIISGLNYSKGEGKEYDGFSKLIFEGEYLNGERNGKGKEYLNGFLLFEGEYLKDKKWEGKGYDSANNIAYELKDDKGLIKEYNEFYNLEYEGEYLNGKRNGKGKEYRKLLHNSLISKFNFEGDYLNGKKHGKGKEYYEDDKLQFEGEYLYVLDLRENFM